MVLSAQSHGAGLHREPDVALFTDDEFLDYAKSQWGDAYYTALDWLKNVDPIHALIPLGDPNHHTVSASTLKSLAYGATGLATDYTLSEAVNAWDTPFTNTAALHLGLGQIPIISPNGTDEELDTLDINGYSFGADGTTGNEPSISIGMWIKIATTVSGSLFAKRTGAPREWRMRMNSGKLQMDLTDTSTGAEINSVGNAAISTATWHHVVATYDGSEAPGGIDLYVDGAVIASTDADNQGGIYAALENGASLPTLFATEGPSDFFAGDVLGGPLGPWVVGGQASANQVVTLFSAQRGLIGV